MNSYLKNWIMLVVVTLTLTLAWLLSLRGRPM